MSDRVDLRDFEAVELFRAALVRFIETTNAALSSAEIEISRTMNWLESEQVPHWKSLLRSTADDLERAKTAYREKRFYKDSSGARQSGIDELKILRKIEAKRAEVEKRASATRRNLRQLQREASMYHGSAHHLRAAVNGKLATAAQELRTVVEQLERYVQVTPDALPPQQEGDVMSRPWAREPAPHDEHDDEAQEQALVALLRARTPSGEIRRGAPRADFLVPLPAVPPAALDSVQAHLTGKAPGRYELITTDLPPDDDGGEVYLHRVAPAGDSGWHIGSARVEAEAVPGSCVTMSAGRLLSQRPEFEPLLALPEGCLLRVLDGKLVLVVDAAGQVIWRQNQEAGEG